MRCGRALAEAAAAPASKSHPQRCLCTFQLSGHHLATCTNWVMLCSCDHPACTPCGTSLPSNLHLAHQPLIPCCSPQWSPSHYVLADEVLSRQGSGRFIGLQLFHVSVFEIIRNFHAMYMFISFKRRKQQRSGNTTQTIAHGKAPTNQPCRY